MLSIKKIFLFTIFLSFVVIFPYITFAQNVPTALQNIELSLSNNNPVPGQDVTLTVKGYSTNVNSANIIWYTNGVETKKGVGQTTLTVKAPELGKKTNISVTIVAIDGKIYKQSAEIGSGSIDIILETSGYVPAYFSGKITPVFQNDIKIVAMPHIADANGVEYDPKNLVYKWEKDGIVLNSASGYGKQHLIIPGTTVPRPFGIIVTATTRDGSRQARVLTNITYRDPSVRFYANDPLYGPMFNRELSGRVYLNTQRELGVLAIPFGFDKPINNIGSLNLSWLINGTLKSDLSQNESIIIRSPEGSFGTSDIGLRINNSKNILQAGENIFSVSFKANTDNTQDEEISF